MGKKKTGDFQKIRFKVGKRLPKGTNVTDTSFKAKKIVIREQLKSNVDALGTLTNRKPTVKDFLNRLLNYNTSVRCDCLVGLKDLLKSKPEVILTNLAGLIEKSCELMVDREFRVRESVLSLLKIIFSHVSPNHITPFFSVMTSYLSCAMTHIVSDIRESSLDYVDIFLEKYPEQTVTVGSQLLHNFLEQISVERESSMGFTVRTLSIEPSSNLSTQNWRISVLERMEKFLTAAVAYWEKSDKKETDSQIKEVFWDGSSPLYVPIYRSGPFTPKLLPQFALNSTDPFAVEGNTLRDPKVVRNFISVLLPLLKETWIEAQPSGTLKRGTMSRSLAETMLSILQVAFLLGQWAEIVDSDTKSSTNLACFQDNFTKDFLTHYVVNFPYSVTVLSKNSPKEGKKNVMLTDLDLNLTICKVYSITVSEFKKIKNSMGHCYDKIVNYLIKIFSDEEVRGPKNVSIALHIVKKIIDNNIKEEFCTKLHVALYTLCENWKSNRKERQDIFDYFVQLCLELKYKPFLSSIPVKSFLRNIPKDIVSEVNNKETLEVLLRTASKIAPKGFEAFIDSLQENDTAIIKLLEQIHYTDEDENLKVQRYVIEIICAIPLLSGSVFRSLSEIFRSNSVSVKNITYLLQVLSFKCTRNQKTGFDNGHFLGLLLCLQFGISVNECATLQKKYQSHRDWNYFRNNTPETSRFTVLPSETNSWKRHLFLTEAVCPLILQFPNCSDVDKAAEIYLKKLLNSCQFLPIHCVAGILNLAAALNFAANGGKSLSNELNITLVELALAGLVTCVLNMNLPENVFAKYRCDKYLDIMFGFIISKECSRDLCQILRTQINEVEALSEGETDCIGQVIVQILKNAELQKDLSIDIARTLNKLQTLNSLKVENKSWYHEACFELKAQLRG